MKITTNNCEAFFLDYYEGNLSEGQVAELFAFLKSNPDLRDVFESFSSVELDTEKVHVPDFTFLKKEPVADIHERAQQWMVDSVDGTISSEDKISLENYLNEYPSKRADLVAFEQTVLTADESETIGDLSRFKKETTITPENFEYYAIALIEGTISPAEKTLLESFVISHPEFKAQLELFRATIQKADETIVFDAKSSLRKSAIVVTKDNIEELLVDKTEGQLSAHDEQAVDVFLNENVEWKRELALLEKTKLTPDSTDVFAAKESLKRGSALINEGNFEQYVISASEGLLNKEELKAFNAFVATNQKYREVLALYAATKLHPDLSVVYADKAGLKRKDKGTVIWFTAGFRYAAAAILVLVFGIYLWTKIDNGGTVPGNVVADGDKPKQNVAPTQNENTPVSPDNNLTPEQTPVNSPDGIAQTPRRGNDRQLNHNGNDVAPVEATPIAFVTTGPASILADHIPNKANDAVSFSDAMYNVAFDNNSPKPVMKETPGVEYISPGQLAMRWIKEKLDGPDRYMEQQQDPWMAAAPGKSEPGNKNVDGLDLAESAVNRVGQSTADGNIAMEQRNDGTYLQLWNYEVRVAN